MKKEIICGIYKIASPTGRIYVGQSQDISVRWNRYKRDCIRGKSFSQPKLESSFKKYGVDVHIFSIIEICTEDQLNAKEIYWISVLNTHKKGMNCSLGGEGGRGIKWSEKSKENSSKMWKGKRKGADNPNYGNGDKMRGENHFMYGKKMSEEKNRKNSEANKLTWGEKIKSDWYNSEEQKQKRKLYNSGRTRSVEVRMRTKETNIQTWAKIINSEEFNSEEQVKIRSERMKRGCATYKNREDYNSEEQKKMRSDRIKKSWETMRANGFVRSPETILRMSIAAKKRYANQKLNICNTALTGS